jgi:urea transport system substrate-binding protein
MRKPGGATKSPDEHKIKIKMKKPKTTIKQFLALCGMAAFACGSLSAAEYPTAEVNTTGLAVTDDTVTVGQLHSITGTMAISETGSVEAERLAIKQINEMGGILGRQIKVVQEDGASDWPTFAEKAKKLIIQDKVAAVFGCWTSASRKAVLPIFEKENNMLYYPTFYEGLEASKNVVYTGQEATQQIIFGLDWAYENLGARTFYLIGSDYIWPRTSMKIARNHIERVLKKKDPSCMVVGEEYYPLGHTNFRSLINKVRLKRPDLMFTAVVGGSNVAWYKQLKAAGITSKTQDMLTISTTEDELLGIGGENAEGFYTSMKYFQSLDIPENKEFVAAFKEMWGDDSVMGDVTQAAYLGPWIYKAAVEKAGSFDIDKIHAAHPGIELNAPEGYVRVHDKNQHLWSKSKIGKMLKNGQIELVATSDELIEPDPFPEGYQ